MAYGDYIPAATLLDTCEADTDDTPGKNADCKFIGQYEGAGSAIANRPHLALAENMDNMKIPLDTMMAQPEITALTGFSGSQIDVDPTGAMTGDVNFVGYLYLGDGSYSGAVQEDLNTLFQLLDSEFNEVVVDGEEVVITASSVALGSGFYNSTAVALTLSHSLPSGNYRLAHGRNTTLATLPEDVLLKTTVRGLQEAAGEVQRISSYICAIDTSDGPADFVGASAVEDALAALPAVVGEGFTLHVRDGSYTLPASWPASGDYINIVGEGYGEVTLTLSADLSVAASVSIERVQLALGAYDLSFGGNCTLSDIYVSGASGTFVQMGSNFSMRNSVVVGSFLKTAGSTKRIVLDAVYIESYGAVLTLDPIDEMHVRASYLAGSGATATGISINNAERVTFEDCDIRHTGVTSRLVYLEDCKDIAFKNCKIETTSSTCPNCVEYATTAQRISFDGCEIISEEGTVVGPTSVGDAFLSFRNCKFSHSAAGAATLHQPFVSLVGSRIVVDNCEFYPENWSPTAFSDQCLVFYNVHSRNILLDMSGQEGNGGIDVQYAWVALQESVVDKIVIDQGAATTVTTPTTAGKAVISIVSSLVQNLSVVGLGGVWEDSGNGSYLIEISSAGGELDGVTFGTRTSAPLWLPYDVAALCSLNGKGSVRNLVWDDHVIDSSSVVDTLISIVGDDNTLENSRLTVDTNNDDIRRLLRVSGNATNNRINNNYFSLTPFQVSPPAGPYYQCVEIIGSSVMGDSDENGQIYGQFCGNTVRYVGYPQDDGTVINLTRSGPLLFKDYVYLWAVDHNVIIAKRDGAGTNFTYYAVFFYVGSHGGAAYKKGAGGCSFTGNIIRAAFGSDSGSELIAAHDFSSPAPIIGNASSPLNLVAGADDTAVITAT